MLREGIDSRSRSRPANVVGSTATEPQRRLEGACRPGIVDRTGGRAVPRIRPGDRRRRCVGIIKTSHRRQAMEGGFSNRLAFHSELRTSVSPAPRPPRPRHPDSIRPAPKLQSATNGSTTWRLAPAPRNGKQRCIQPRKAKGGEAKDAGKDKRINGTR